MPVITAVGDDCGSRLGPQRQASCFGFARGDGGDVAVVGRLVLGAAVGKQGAQHAVGGSADGGLRRCAGHRRDRRRHQERLGVPVDGADRIVDRQVHGGQVGGEAWPLLLRRGGDGHAGVNGGGAHVVPVRHGIVVGRREDDVVRLIVGARREQRDEQGGAGKKLETGAGVKD